MRSLHPETREEPPSPQLEESPSSNKDAAQPKINKWIIFFFFKTDLEFLSTG